MRSFRPVSIYICEGISSVNEEGGDHMMLRTKEKRQLLLHRRAKKLQKSMLRRQLAVISAVTAALSICLCMLILSAGMQSPVGTGNSYTGASLLLDDTGGYVLVAVIAFMAGVIITTVIQYYRRKKQNR